MPLPPRTSLKSRTQKSSKPKKAKQTTSCLRIFFEIVLFIGWLIFTGVAGYFTGLTSYNEPCPSEKLQQSTTTTPASNSITTNDCPITSDTNTAYDNLKKQWLCSRARANDSQVNKMIYPEEGSYEKTKWKSILTVEPKEFFDKYLSQYPGDTKAVQPVVVFSHRPLEHIKDITDVCKVMDVAIVPDSPGVCVAVTETYHDVASYHMLHANRQADGTYALTSNNIPGRVLPTESNYAVARALLLEYFTHIEYVDKMVKKVPKAGGNKVIIGCLVENLQESLLFKNSLKSGYDVGISKAKFYAFTTSKEVEESLKVTGVKVLYLPEIKDVGRTESCNIEYNIRRYFIQAWLAFAIANSQNKLLWQSPGTYWLDKPDNIVNSLPIVEVLWSYKGRDDIRGAPFFVSFDFFIPSYAERCVHLMHEILLHFDLVLAWLSLDALAAYRLSENNSRYGTSTHIIPPFLVLHTNLFKHDPIKIKEAIKSKDHPMAIVVPIEGLTYDQIEKIIKDSGMWKLDSTNS